MRQQLSVCFFLMLLSLSMKATECVERYFSESQVNIYLCQNYSNYNETRTLLYEARAKVLNDYILNSIEGSFLQDKKFEIQIYDAALTYQHLELTQGKNGYFVNMSGFPTLEKLITIADYFSKSNWQPFIAGDVVSNINNDVVEAQIVNFYKTNIRTNSSTFHQKSFSVWSQDNLQLKYVNDGLIYFINEIPLAIEATSSLPIKIKDRFLLFQYDIIFVTDKQKIIKRLKVDKPISEDYDIYQYNSWINICHAGEDNWLYSYSYSENRFYARP